MAAVLNVRFCAGLALASGLAATMTITHMLKAGDGVVCMDDVYGGKRTPCVALRHVCVGEMCSPEM